ncbi:hypothetical protein GCM10022380_08680 [Amycolatopsis tucumanensis]|uniref:Uncharacterized protein n=1 Tax=Amycolatopsis tucumanensis TaxID=401106 RepID=A0ABP7HGJ0_9PSEU
MPTRPAAASRGHVVEPRPTQTDTSAGSSDTEVNELAAMPTGPSGPRAHNAVTPLGNRANAFRSARLRSA